MLIETSSKTANARPQTPRSTSPKPRTESKIRQDSYQRSSGDDSSLGMIFPGASAAFGLAATVAPFFTDNPWIRYGGPALALGITGMVGGIAASEMTDAVEKGAKPKFLKNALLGAVGGAALGVLTAGTPIPVVPSIYGCFCAGLGLQMQLLGEFDNEDKQ